MLIFQEQPLLPTLQEKFRLALPFLRVKPQVHLPLISMRMELVEGSETGTFTISNPSSGIVLGTTTTGEVTITEDDCICDSIDYPNLDQPNTVENTIL
jgi:hypothetical protein